MHDKTRLTYINCYDNMLTERVQEVCRVTEAEKLQKLTENFLCLNEEGKKYTAAMVEALAHACAGAVPRNYVDGEPNIYPPGQTEKR